MYISSAQYTRALRRIQTWVAKPRKEGQKDHTRYEDYRAPGRQAAVVPRER
jgi:hypothetical protein